MPPDALCDGTFLPILLWGDFMRRIRGDISILAAAGADSKLLLKIFLTEGVLIASLGTISGLIIGAVAVLVQQKFGIVSMGMESSVTEGYPIKMVASDFIYVLSMMAIVTTLISFRPAVLAARFASVRHL